MSQILKKSALFTDIHFGRKGNSPQHNADCIAYIKWFCEQVQQDPTIDHVIFMGDWHEHRGALSVNTLNFSYVGAEMINRLGLPVFFCVGNHDLFHRHTREMYSVVHFNEFKNFTLIDTPTVIKHIADGALISPFLFDAEYTSMADKLNIPFWAGHFEFKGFLVTGHSMRMQTGPDPLDFKGPKQIVSGHFHKRQANDNITYIGNTFPMDFSDANDILRGMAITDHYTGELSFKNWDDCPKYTKATLSQILDGDVVIHAQSTLKCIVDIPITFEESTVIKSTFAEKYNLRDISMDETAVDEEALTSTETSVDVSDSSVTVDEMVVTMLSDIKSDRINSNKLVNIYKGLSD